MPEIKEISKPISKQGDASPDSRVASTLDQPTDQTNYPNQSNQPKKIPRWLIPVGLGMLGGIIVLFLAYRFFISNVSSIFVSSQFGQGQGKGSEQSHQEPTPTPVPTPPIYTIALLGYGGAGHDGGALTDSIMVAKIDTGSEKIGLISIPRDSWVGLPTNGWDQPEQHWKINAAYAIGIDDRGYPKKPTEFTGDAGGGSLARYGLEEIVGFPVQHFVAVDFTGFKRAIDVLGGVTVKVERPLTDPYYPIPGKEDDTCEKSEEEIAQLTATLSGDLLQHEFACRYEVLSFEPGRQLMDGETALKFARSRHAPNDGGDFNRSARQRAVLFAARDKILAIDFIPKIIPFLQTITGHLRTDMSVEFIREMLDQRETFLGYEVVAIPLTTDATNALGISTSANGQSIVVPKDASRSAVLANEVNWQSVHEYIDGKLNPMDQLNQEEINQEVL